MEAVMRGQFSDQGRMFSYVSPEERVPKGHPLRAVRAMFRAVLEELHGDFARLYTSDGRPSISPEQLLSALLLQVFYGIRSERQLMEQLDYNLLYRWFVSLDADAAVWVPTTFTKNRERLQQGDIFQGFMTVLLNHRKVKPLLSGENFSVDGKLIEARPATGASSPRTARAETAPTCFDVSRPMRLICSTDGLLRLSFNDSLWHISMPFGGLPPQQKWERFLPTV
jgi:transposase